MGTATSFTADKIRELIDTTLADIEITEDQKLLITRGNGVQDLIPFDVGAQFDNLQRQQGYDPRDYGMNDGITSDDSALAQTRAAIFAAGSGYIKLPSDKELTAGEIQLYNDHQFCDVDEDGVGTNFLIPMIGTGSKSTTISLKTATAKLRWGHTDLSTVKDLWGSGFNVFGGGIALIGIYLGFGSEAMAVDVTSRSCVTTPWMIDGLQNSWFYGCRGLARKYQAGNYSAIFDNCAAHIKWIGGQLSRAGEADILVRDTDTNDNPALKTRCRRLSFCHGLSESPDISDAGSRVANVICESVDQVTFDDWALNELSKPHVILRPPTGQRTTNVRLNGSCQLSGGSVAIQTEGLGSPVSAYVEGGTVFRNVTTAYKVENTSTVITVLGPREDGSTPPIPYVSVAGLVEGLTVKRAFSSSSSVNPRPAVAGYSRGRGVPTTDLLVVQNRLYAYPIVIGEEWLFDQLQVRVSVAATSGACRLPVFKDNGEGRPGSLLIGVSTSTLSATGNREGDLVTPSRFYSGLHWLGFFSTGSPATQATVKAITGPDGMSLYRGGLANLWTATNWFPYVDGTFNVAGNEPAEFGVPTGYTDKVPLVVVRRG